MSLLAAAAAAGLAASLVLVLAGPAFGATSGGDDYVYNVGVGIHDMTGPIAEVGMMGYAMFNQISHGLHFRLRARAFVMETAAGAGSGAAGTATKFPRVVFVNVDGCMVFTSVKQEVVRRLQAKYGAMYSDDNVVMSGIHTHAGPAGFSQYPLYDLTSWGFVKKNWETVVGGVVAAVEAAHESVQKDVRILVNKGELLNTNINRSPYAYTFNPPAERARYKYDVDKEMTVLRFETRQGKELGMLNWFPVHGTSLNNSNELVSGDNKGYASYLFEKEKNGDTASGTYPGQGSFVAAFGQANEGDVSPNTRGAFCHHNFSWPCSYKDSTCDGKAEGCQGYGPGKDGDEFESLEIIGRQQFEKALSLYNSASVALAGPVNARHMFVNMEDVEVSGNFTPNGVAGRTCLGALGDGFAGGTTDGAGDFDFHQGTNNTHTNPYWNFLAAFISDPTPEQRKCQYPKPILLNTGGITYPAKWTAGILPLQILRVGQLFIVSVPGEFTTMSGRRLREQVNRTLVEALPRGSPEPVIVIAGLSGAYSHYVATPEEFHVQRYEGGSTLYGPLTLPAYLQEYTKIARALATDGALPSGPTPPDLSKKTFSFLPGVVVDGHPLGSHFGAVRTQPSTSALKAGADTAKVQFWGANPRNDYRLQETYLTVDRKDEKGTWHVVRVDGDPDTRLRWASHGLDESIISIEWIIPTGTPPGTYRFRTFGSAKEDPLSDKLTSYTGTSNAFTVVA